MNENENCLVLYTDTSSLMDLAGYRVALTFFRTEIIDLPLTERLPRLDDIVAKHNIKSNPSVPSRLQDMIVEYIRRIKENLNDWTNMGYFCLEHSFDFHSSFLKNSTWIKYFDDLVWNAENHTIDHLKTCLVLLQSDRLQIHEKFAMACWYCLENQIKNLWSDPMLHDIMTTRSWPLSYWIDRLLSQNSDEIFSPVYDEEYIIKISPNRWAIEYFWPHISLHGQVSIVLSQLYTFKYHSCLKQLLPKLSEPILQRILPKRGGDIMKVLISCEKFVTVSFWNHVSHMFDSSQFFQLVEWMLLCEGKCGPRSLNEDVTSVCQQIWHCAPQHLKEHAINSLSTDYVFRGSKLCNDFGCCRSAILLKMVLSGATAMQRYQIWTWENNWINFCMHRRKSDMDQLFELCLPDADKRVEFKQKHMTEDQIAEYCDFLIENSQNGQLDDFLEFCSIDLDASVEMKQIMVQKYLFRMFLNIAPARRLKCIDSVVKAIDACFPNLEQSACFKKKMVSSDQYLSYAVEQLREGNFAPVIKLVTACLPGEQEVQEWGELLASYCRRDLKSKPLLNFNPSQWQDFLMWCLGSEEKIMQFKRSLDVDEALGVFLQAYETRRCCEAFRDFLNWSLDRENLAALKRKYIEINADNDEILNLVFAKNDAISLIGNLSLNVLDKN